MWCWRQFPHKDISFIFLRRFERTASSCEDTCFTQCFYSSTFRTINTERKLQSVVRKCFILFNSWLDLAEKKNDSVVNCVASLTSFRTTNRLWKVLLPTPTTVTMDVINLHSEDIIFRGVVWQFTPNNEMRSSLHEWFHDYSFEEKITSKLYRCHT